MATLYVIATPIGNLEDITLRAIRVLKEVSVVFCEDTRTTRVLLQKYDIHTPTESLNARTERMKTDRVISLLSDGKDVAYVSDAGTPGISDPGSYLVKEVREKCPESIVVPIPGASAIATILSASGVLNKEFMFYGFLPHKKGRETILRKIAESEIVSVFYESPHRIEKTLTALSGKPVKITIGRELTKKFEEFIVGSAEEVLLKIQNAGGPRGEFTVIVSPLSDYVEEDV
jgi:16S rRNA (cytidine1402-2'-O)-methyltransferase